MVPMLMAALIILSMTVSFAETKSSGVPIALPDAMGGIGFDDMEFAAGLGKFLVPGGRTGNLYIIDPKTSAVGTIKGFSKEEEYHGGHGQSITSADEGGGCIFVADRDTRQLYAVDPKSKTVLASANLKGNPDYVRYIKSTNEVWVTQPSSQQIEVFKYIEDKPMISHKLIIEVPGGPESLIEDTVRQHVYTHLWQGQTVVIDAHSHQLINIWPNGCVGSRGIALDEHKGFLFVGCEEGKAVVLDLNHQGKELSSIESGLGVDVISYNPQLAHLYLPGAESASMAILKVSDKGELSLFETVKTAQGDHCAAADKENNVLVCDPDRGLLIKFKDHL